MWKEACSSLLTLQTDRGTASPGQKHCRVHPEPSCICAQAPVKGKGSHGPGVGLGWGVGKEVRIPSQRGGGRAACAKSQRMSVVPTDVTCKTKSKIALLRISGCWLHGTNPQGWGSVWQCTPAGGCNPLRFAPLLWALGVLGAWPVHQEDWFLHPWPRHSSVGPAASRTELSMILFSWEKNYRNEITDF